ncbi:MAG: rhodanese-like domain-containing protein [Proteobacteria bacterium]|nr:rhodanese-like domain-containing protein [Pseudomonadota bacterium]MBU1738259.1 rhodanese-like domain-containing protein [Pseudomonadota bacterium]
MKRIIQLLCLSFCCLAAVSCSGEKPAAEKKSAVVPAARPAAAPAQQSRQAGIFRTISPGEAQNLIATKKDLLLVDVRNPQELREGFIANSRLVPFWEIAKGQTSLPENQPLLLICAVGGRSYAVGQFLNRKGYPEVYNLQGGISAWKAAGLPLQYQ